MWTCRPTTTWTKPSRPAQIPTARRPCVLERWGSYQNYYAPTLQFPTTVAELAALRGPDRAVWVLYSFPRDMRLRFSQLYAYLQQEFSLMAVFRGTLGDGDLYVVRTPKGVPANER